MKTYKIQCNCSHKFQDETYGKQTRIATPTNRQPSPTTIVVRCTVCQKETTTSK